MHNRNRKNDPFLYSSEEEGEEAVDDCRNFCKLQRNNYFMQYLRDSSVHGLKYIGQVQEAWFARTFWVAAIGGSVGVSVYLIMIGVAADVQSNPVIMSFQESEIGINRIPFPAVTICTSSKRKTSVVAEQLREFLEIEKTLNQTNETKIWQDYWRRYYSLHYLTDLCRDSNSFSDHFKKPYTVPLPEYKPETNAELEFSLGYAKKALHQCDDIILLCLWGRKPMNCSSEFTSIITEYGHCCTFNLMPEFLLRKDFPQPKRRNNNSHNRRNLQRQLIRDAWSKWDIDKHLIEKETEVGQIDSDTSEDVIDVPKHQKMAGMTSGLSLLLHPDLNNAEYDHCDSMDGVGFRVQVHSPIDYPHISDFGKTIEPNTETFLDIEASITLPDKDVKRVSKVKRQCYFRKEYKLSSFKIYTQQNCVDECIMKAVFKKCNCVRIYMPRQNQRLCITDNDYACIKNVTHDIKEEGTQEFCQHCWPSCTQVEYFADTTDFPLRDDVDLWKNSTFGEHDQSKWSQEKVAVVHLYFSKETVESRARKALYSTIDILASAGGVLGLTLGVSMISIAEPIYYLTIRIFFQRKVSPSPVTVNDKLLKHANLKPKKIRVKPIHIKQHNQQLFVTRRIPREWITD